MGVKLGIETKTERFHPMAIAALSTQNLVTATEHLARYKKLTAPEEILNKLSKEEFSVAFRWLLAVNAEPRVLTDYCFSWMISLARHGTGTQLNPLRVEYVQQRQNLRVLERSLGCKVVGGASRNAIIFRASDATTFFVTRNVELTRRLPSTPRPNVAIFSKDFCCASTRHNHIIGLNHENHRHFARGTHGVSPSV